MNTRNQQKDSFCIIRRSAGWSSWNDRSARSAAHRTFDHNGCCVQKGRGQSSSKKWSECLSVLPPAGTTYEYSTRTYCTVLTVVYCTVSFGEDECRHYRWMMVRED
jgi:hypothetical protein